MHEVHVLLKASTEAEAETGVAGGTELQEEGILVTAYAAGGAPGEPADWP